MSFSLAQGVGLATLANRFAEQGAALFGAAGPVVLGEFIFNGFEVPESITIGGQQQMTVHTVPGGERVIDVMGRADDPLEWSGVMLGPLATVRERGLREIMNRGRPVTLLFGAYYYTVVVARFVATYARDSYIPYQISCVVLRDEMAEPAVPQISAAAQVLGDLAGAAMMVGTLVTPPPMPARADGVVLPLPADAIALADAAALEASREGFRRGAATQVACAAALAIARASVRDGLDGAGAVAGEVAADAAPGGLVADVDAFLAAVVACEQMARMAGALGAVWRAEQNAVLGSV